MERPKCIHCKIRLALTHKRGLCHKCYFNLAIRNRYPCQQRHAPKGETLADLDAMEAEARKNLPEWWDKELPKGERNEGAIRVVRVHYRRNGRVIA